MITTNEVAELFAQGFDCSQVIVSYFAEDLGIDDKTAKELELLILEQVCLPEKHVAHMLVH